MIAKTHKDLDVYKFAFNSAVRIYEKSKEFPKEEKYSLTDQIRRSSRSVCANLAEAFRKRRYEKHFISKLSDCESESAETQVWLDFALRFEYITEEEYAVLYQEFDYIIGKLVNMINTAPQWSKGYNK